MPLLINGKTLEAWGEMESQDFLEELAKVSLAKHKWKLNEVKELIIRHIHTCLMRGNPSDAVAVLDYITQHGLKVDSNKLIKFDKKRGRPPLHFDGIFKAGCEMLDQVFSRAVDLLNIRKKSKLVAGSDLACEWEAVPHTRLLRAEADSDREAFAEREMCGLVKRMKLLTGGEESKEDNRVIIALLKQLVENTMPKSAVVVAAPDGK